MRLEPSVACLGVAPLLARRLRLNGLMAQLAAFGARRFLASVAAVYRGLWSLERRVALIFTIGATSFAATMVDEAGHVGMREMKG